MLSKNQLPDKNFQPPTLYSNMYSHDTVPHYQNLHQQAGPQNAFSTKLTDNSSFHRNRLFSLGDSPVDKTQNYTPTTIRHRNASSQISVMAEPWNLSQEYVPLCDLEDESHTPSLYGSSSPISPASPATWQQCSFDLQQASTPHCFQFDSSSSPSKRRRGVNEASTFTLLPLPDQYNRESCFSNGFSSLPMYNLPSDKEAPMTTQCGAIFSPHTGSQNVPPYSGIVSGNVPFLSPASTLRNTTPSGGDNCRTKRRHSEASTSSNFVNSIPGVYFDKRKKGFRVRFQNVYVGWVSLSRYSTYEEAYLVAKRIWDEAVREVAEAKDKQAAINAGIGLQIQSRLKGKNPGGRPRTVSRLSPAVDAKLSAAVENARKRLGLGMLPFPMQHSVDAPNSECNLLQQGFGYSRGQADPVFCKSQSFSRVQAAIGANSVENLREGAVALPVEYRDRQNFATKHTQKAPLDSNCQTPIYQLPSLAHYASDSSIGLHQLAHSYNKGVDLWIDQEGPNSSEKLIPSAQQKGLTFCSCPSLINHQPERGVSGCNHPKHSQKQATAKLDEPVPSPKLDATFRQKLKQNLSALSTTTSVGSFVPECRPSIKALSNLQGVSSDCSGLEKSRATTAVPSSLPSVLRDESQITRTSPSIQSALQSVARPARPCQGDLQPIASPDWSGGCSQETGIEKVVVRTVSETYRRDINGTWRGLDVRESEKKIPRESKGEFREEELSSSQKKQLMNSAGVDALSDQLQISHDRNKSYSELTIGAFEGKDDDVFHRYTSSQQTEISTTISTTYVPSSPTDHGSCRSPKELCQSATDGDTLSLARDATSKHGQFDERSKSIIPMKPTLGVEETYFSPRKKLPDRPLLEARLCDHDIEPPKKQKIPPIPIASIQRKCQQSERYQSARPVMMTLTAFGQMSSRGWRQSKGECEDHVRQNSPIDQKNGPSLSKELLMNGFSLWKPFQSNLTKIKDQLAQKAVHFLKHGCSTERIDRSTIQTDAQKKINWKKCNFKDETFSNLKDHHQTTEMDHLLPQSHTPVHHLIAPIKNHKTDETNPPPPYLNSCYNGKSSLNKYTNNTKFNQKILSPNSMLKSMITTYQLPLWSIISFNELKFYSIVKHQLIKMNETNQNGTNSFYPTHRTHQLIKINNGTFCSVYKGKLRQIDVAIKCPLKYHLMNDLEMMQIRALKEWKLLARSRDHPNILKLYGGVILSPYEIWIVTEYVKGGDLFNKLCQENKNPIPPIARLHIMTQIASSIHHLHSLYPKIVHKDLKTNNVLIDEKYQVKLCDLGDAEEIYPGQSLKWYTAVTWQYAPPEIVLARDPSRPEHGVGQAVDIWSLGCIFLELCYQPTPFRHLLENIDPLYHHKILQSYLKNNASSTTILKLELPNSLSTLINWCLKFNPNERPTAQQICYYLHRFHSSLLKELTYLKIASKRFLNLS